MKANKISILYVDDEVNNLNAFKATFRRDFKVHLANSAILGEEILENNHIDIIITDYRMPDVTGVEFFEKIINKYPEPIRILLTGYADIDAVINAINKGEIYRFIRKPWNESELRITIQNAYEILSARKEIKEKNEELRESFNELDRFVYSAAHDLTAPLTSIMGILQIAKVEKENSEEYLSMIEKSVNKLHVFVSSIIDYHRNKKLDHGKVKIDFKTIIQDTLDNFTFYQDMSSVNFDIQIKDDISFISDDNRLKIIFNNLVSNAIKYQKENEPEPTVTIHVTVNEENAEILIKDNGIGISEDHKNHVFDMYFRASNEHAGTGIGLYIVKEVVNKLSGTISLTSEIGKGTEFVLNIPNDIQ